MLTRRDLLAVSALTGFTFAAGPWLRPAFAQEAVSPGTATSFVLKLGQDLVRIIDGPGSYEAKKQQLGPLVEQAVDVNGIARFCLGRFWRTATPAQQTQYTGLFHDVLLNNIFGKIGEFRGVTFQATNTVMRGPDALVGTLIKRPNQEANNVQWDVQSVGGQPKVVDVIAEGTSLRLTQRADYSSYLTRNNDSVAALITAMQGQIHRQ